jgi:hypothetical protein
MEISGGMTAQRGLRRAIGFSANMPNVPRKSNLRTFRRGPLVELARIISPDNRRIHLAVHDHRPRPVHGLFLP